MDVQRMLNRQFDTRTATVYLKLSIKNCDRAASLHGNALAPAIGINIFSCFYRE